MKRKTWYKYVLFNEVTNELGIPLLVNNMYLIDTGMLTGYKAYTSKWVMIGDL